MAKMREAPNFDSIWTPKTIFEELNRYVIGQDRAKRVAALAAYNHLKRIQAVIENEQTLIKKSNVLMIGPTGVGKTHIARVLAKMLDLPMIVADATEYTEAGYYGKDVEVMVAELLFKANLSVEETERGIIFVDEVDKLARKSGGMRTGAGNRDIGGEGVQQSLLKLLEGRKIFVPYNVTQHWNKHDFVEVDTTNILFICAGTYTDLRTGYENKPIGFDERDIKKRITKKKITHKQLLEYGMLEELLGRIPIITQLEFLTKEDLVRIMTEPPDCLVNEYKELMAIDDIELSFSKGAIEAMADFAAKRGIGARGLKSVMEEILHDYLFDAPDMRGKKLKITVKTVESKLANFDSGMFEEEG